MSREQFLKKLNVALNDVLDKNELNAKIEYYDGYISDEVKKGRREEEVIEELGDPTLIAKTIKTVSGGNTLNQSDFSSSNEDEHYRNRKNE